MLPLLTKILPTIIGRRLCVLPGLHTAPRPRQVSLPRWSQHHALLCRSLHRNAADPLGQTHVVANKADVGLAVEGGTNSQASVKPSRRTLMVSVSDGVGVLTSVTGLFSKNNVNMESLSVGLVSGQAEFTIVADLNNQQALDLTQQFQKDCPNVQDVQILPDDDTTRRELSIIRFPVERAGPLKDFQQIMGGSGAVAVEMLDITRTSMTVAIAASPSWTERIIDALDPSCIEQVVRTGEIVLGPKLPATLSFRPEGPSETPFMVSGDHILSMMVSHRPGVLNKIVEVLSENGVSIKSTTTASCAVEGFHRITMVVPPSDIPRILSKLRNIPEVSDLSDLTTRDKGVQVCELVLWRLMKSGKDQDTELSALVNAYGGRFIRLDEKYITLQFMGNPTKLHHLHGLLTQQYLVLQVIRTGSIAMLRS